jgi:hypothetical protein
MRLRRRALLGITLAGVVVATVGCRPAGYHSVDLPESELARLKSERDRPPSAPPAVRSARPVGKPDRSVPGPGTRKAR